MEFMQIGVGINSPLNLLGSWIWAAFPRLINQKGQEFLQSYLPAGVELEQCMLDKALHFPFSCRDESKYVELAIHSELLKGNQVFLDLTEIDGSSTANEDFAKMWPITQKWLLKRGLDTTQQPVEVACFAQAFNGGLLIDHQGATNIRGLFAAGEVAGGQCGADRLGGDMLLACQVFGKRAGTAAARYATEVELANISDSYFTDKIADSSELAKKQIDVQGLRNVLRQVASEHLFVLRSDTGLRQALEVIADLENKLANAPVGDEYNFQSIELQSLLITAKIMAHAALARVESRGSHYRVDYPEERIGWNKSQYIRIEGGKLVSDFVYYEI